MRIAELGSINYYGHADSIDFSSKETLIDFDAVIIDFSKLAYIDDERSKTTQSIANKVVNEIIFDRIFDNIIRRNEEIRKLLELGRYIFVHTPAPIICYTTKTNTVNLLDYFNFAKLNTKEAIGKNIEFKGQTIFSPLWNTNKQNFEYRAYFQEPVGKPMFFVRDTQYTIGSYSKTDKGHLIFLPYLRIPHDRFKAPEVVEPFINSILNLIKDLEQENAGKIDFPSWSKKYKLPDENNREAELSKLEDELDVLQQRISEKKHEVEEIERQKILFLGTGKPLELEIKKIFEALGFTAEETQHNRDDLILTHGNRVAVIEIKGVKNSAAEKHAAQLEKWVNEYYGNHDIQPKGILIVNTYNDLPLERRIEPSFPDQMCRYSVAREHCLMTALQLLCLFLDCRDDENKKKEIIEHIFSTKGIFTEYQNWQDFINQEDEPT